MDRAVLRDIHRYWFGELKGREHIPEDKRPMWFTVKDETDSHIRETYGRYLPEALAEAWGYDALSREEAAGLIVLLDQFPRNIFRQSGEAFAYDAKAREVARALLPRIEEFYWVERGFIGLTFTHSESIDDQDFAMLYTSRSAVEGPAGLKEYHRVYLDFAGKHRDLIRKFGRFPHRNVMLGRETTAEEARFLKEHGRGY